MRYMSTEITPERRRELATALGKSDAYLYQCLNKHRQMKPAEAVLIEQATKGELSRWHLRPEDWFKIWPELIGKKGAPKVPTSESEKA